MNAILLIAAGAIIMWIGMTDSIRTVLKQAEEPLAPGYPNVPFLPYAMAAAVVTAPLLVVPNSREWAWKYVFLVLLMAVVANYEGIDKFYQDLVGFYGG